MPRVHIHSSKIKDLNELRNLSEDYLYEKFENCLTQVIKVDSLSPNDEMILSRLQHRALANKLTQNQRQLNQVTSSQQDDRR